MENSKAERSVRSTDTIRNTLNGFASESRIDADVKKEIYEEMLVVMDRNTI
ncbi:MAG: hypothetical protein R3A12_13210 [Ignavibacteria bacterium]